MKRHFLTKILCVAVIGIAAFSFSARAQVVENIEWDSLADFILNPDGSKAVVGDSVLLGLFPNAFDFSANQTFASLSAAFTQLDSTTIAAPGQFTKSFAVNTAGFEGRQLYIWAFNNATASSASAWAILTNPASAWKVPPDTGSTIIDTSDIGVFVPAGARGLAVMPSQFPGAPNNTDWKMLTAAAIPEPSTYASALFGLGALGFGAIRRRANR